MKAIGMYKAKTHLTEVVKELETGQEFCITNRGKKVGFIIPVAKYYSQKMDGVFRKLQTLKKRVPIGSIEEIIDMKNTGRK